MKCNELPPTENYCGDDINCLLLWWSDYDQNPKPHTKHTRMKSPQATEPFSLLNQYSILWPYNKHHYTTHVLWKGAPHVLDWWGCSDWTGINDARLEERMGFETRVWLVWEVKIGGGLIMGTRAIHGPTRSPTTSHGLIGRINFRIKHV